MYLLLHWNPSAGADPAQVRDDIVQAAAQMPFENGMEPANGCYVANIRHGRGSGDVFDFETNLRALAPGRFSFTLVYVGKGNLILHSVDVDSAALSEIVDY